MNTMFYAIMFSLMAFATADRLRIVNNCAADFEIESIYGPSGTGILCYEMKKIAVGNQIVIDNFYYDEDIVLLKSSAKSDSDSFTYIDTLRSLMKNEDDIGGECAKLVKSGNVKAYTVEPGVPHLTLCANKPSPTPPSPKQNTITNKCSNKFEFAQVKVNPRANIVCSSSVVIPGGKQLSYTPVGTPGYVIIKTASIKDTPNFRYMGTLQSLIDLESDADGKCQKLINSGFNAVYAPINAQMTLCA
jgi:hypothetical protein